MKLKISKIKLEKHVKIRVSFSNFSREKIELILEIII